MYDIQDKTFFQLAADPAFWLHLNPRLTISENGSPVSSGRESFNLSTTAEKRTLEDLQEEGYFKVAGVWPAEEMQPLIDAMQKIHDDQWPTPFVFVYDEFWLQFQKLAGLLSQVLGAKYQMMPALWAFFVEPGGKSAGFLPHRDRSRKLTIAPDGKTIALNIWISLTDATPDTGCIYLLPLQYDRNFPHNLGVYGTNNYQDFRAVPTKAGDILAWNEAVYHWGGRSSKHGTFTRMSIAASFQRGDSAPFETPILHPLKLPTFKQRVSLIASQLLRYQAQAGLSPVLKQLAVDLVALDERLVVNDDGGPFIYDADGERRLVK